MERRHHVDRKAVVRALRHQEIRRAAPVLAEMEVEADHRAGDGEPLDQDALDEFLGATGPPAPRRRSARSRRRARSPPAAAAWRPREVSWNEGSSGWKKLRGCGSKVSTAAGRWARAGALHARSRSPRDGRGGPRRNCRWRRPAGPAGRGRDRHRARRRTGGRGGVRPWRGGGAVAAPCRFRRRQVKEGWPVIGSQR